MVMGAQGAVCSICTAAVLGPLFYSVVLSPLPAYRFNINFAAYLVTFSSRCSHVVDIALRSRLWQHW